MPEHLLHPICINPKTKEPFLGLPSPYSKMIITPPRISDVEFLVPILNDPSVFHWMTGPPHPYLNEHGLAWITEQIQQTDAVIQDLQSREATGNTFPTGCPVRIIREVQSDDSDMYIGYIGLYRSERRDILDDDERRRVLTEDDERKPGDPDIVWDLAYYLKPSHHGRGIMSAAVKTVIDQWAVPRLNSRIIRASVLQGNAASVRVLEKVGFAVVRAMEDYEEVRGEKRGVTWLGWTPRDLYESG